MNNKTPFELFNFNMINKLVLTLDSLMAINRSKELILSSNLLPIFKTNQKLVENLKDKKIKICFYENTDPKSYNLETENIVVISSNEKNQLNSIINFMNQIVNNKKEIELKIFFFLYPKSTYITNIIIKKKANQNLKIGIKNTGEFLIRSLSFDFFPIDDDLLSLEYELTSQELYWNKEFNIHNLSAEALFKFQIGFGKFEDICFLGSNGEKVYKILESIEKENEKDVDNLTTVYDTCIILDRNLDMLTPFMTQFTYLGLLDEIFNISFGTININKTIVDKYADPEEMMNYHLFNKKDKLEFDKLKNSNCITLITKIQEIANRIKNKQNITNDIDEKKAREMIEMIKFSNFGSIHINLTTKVLDYLKKPQISTKNKIQQALLLGEDQSYLVEDLIDLIQVNIDIKIVISLIISLNIIFDGFSTNHFKKISLEFVNNYGLEKINVLLVLTQNGFFIDKGNSNHKIFEDTNFGLYKNIFKNEKSSQIFSNYNQYISPMVHIFKSLLENTLAAKKLNFKFSKTSKLENFQNSKKIVLFVIGGLTYSEIISIRQISEELGKEVIIAVTNIVNTESILNGLYD